jgi:hypothetical protein
LSELAGYTERVFNMIFVMEELSKNHYMKNAQAHQTEFTIENIEGIRETGYQGKSFF